MRLIKTQAVSESFKKWAREAFYTLHALQVIEFPLDNNLPTPTSYRAGPAGAATLLWSVAGSNQELLVTIHPSGFVEMIRHFEDGTFKQWRGEWAPSEFLDNLDHYRAP